MSQAKAQTGTPPVSLFPFLAVLLCTMGALIVILVAIAHQARRHALQMARAQQAKAQARLQQQLQKLQAQWQRLQGLAEQLENGLQQDEQQLEQLANHNEKLEHEVRRWQALLASEGEELDAEELDRLRRQLVWYQHKLQEVQAQLKEKTKPQPAVSYAIVPFQGRHGTRRRPIYIECREDSVLIQPGDVELRAKDFLHVGPENPLLAALRATVQHWRREGLPPEETPYPLILVRPKGVAAYYAVRRALQNWKGPLGYELIEGHWQLEFGDEDPRLIQLQRLAVQKARRLQLQLARGSSGIQDAADQGLYQADTFGGLRPVGPSAGHTRGSGIGSGGRSTGRNTGGGFGAQAFQPTRSTTPAARPEGAAGSGTALADAAFSPGGTPGLGHTGGLSLSGAPARSADTGFGSGSSGKPALPGGTAPARGKLPSLQSTLARGGSAAGGHSLFGNDSANLSNGNTPAGAAPDPTGFSSRQSQAGSSASGGGTPSGTSGVAGGGTGGQATGRGAGGIGVAASSGGSSALGLSSSSGGAGGGSAASATGAASGSPAQQQSGSLGFSALLNQGDPTRSAAAGGHARQHGGSGTPALMEDPPPGAIPLRRAITANLYPDRLVVLHNGSLRATVIPLNQPLGRWASQLTDVLAREIQAWGKAGRGMYWKPALRVHVAPGAQKNWQLLQQALRTSGLELQPIR